MLRVFPNRDYSVLEIYSGGACVHRSCVFPAFFRFPFMARNDLQIGDTWTANDHRGKGLATWAVDKIIELYSTPDRRIWYVTEQVNQPSVGVATKAGFSLIGYGFKKPRLGASFLGYYAMCPSVAPNGVDASVRC